MPDGWAYEGWTVINGVPLSTGKFTTAQGADEAATFSGNKSGPPFPGEDFLRNAPAGLSFPVDLSEAAVVISVEPSPDDSPAPFTLKPLVRALPNDIIDHFNYSLVNKQLTGSPTIFATLY